MTFRASKWILVLAVFGCGDDPGNGDSGIGDGAVADTSEDTQSDSGPCTDCTELSFQVELESAGGSVDLADGVVAEWEWGFQGGTMIRPRVVFEEGSVEVGEEVRVELTHAPDPDAPEAFGEVAGFSGVTLELRVIRDADERLSLAAIDDQLGWDELDGTRLVLGVSVQAGPARGSRSGAISLMVPEGPCDVFERTGAGCSYYVIPGTAEVSLSASEGACTDAQAVDLAFTPTDVEGADACAMAQGGAALSRGYSFVIGSGDPPEACLEGMGLTDGATVGGSALLIAVGTCAPTGFELDADDGSCQELCAP